jgi:hypothetical protein
VKAGLKARGKELNLLKKSESRSIKTGFEDEVTTMFRDTAQREESDQTNFDSSSISSFSCRSSPFSIDNSNDFEPLPFHSPFAKCSLKFDESTSNELRAHLCPPIKVVENNHGNGAVSIPNMFTYLCQPCGNRAAGVTLGSESTENVRDRKTGAYKSNETEYMGRLKTPCGQDDRDSPRTATANLWYSYTNVPFSMAAKTEYNGNLKESFQQDDRDGPVTVPANLPYSKATKTEYIKQDDREKPKMAAANLSYPYTNVPYSKTPANVTFNSSPWSTNNIGNLHGFGRRVGTHPTDPFAFGVHPAVGTMVKNEIRDLGLAAKLNINSPNLDVIDPVAKARIEDAQRHFGIPSEIKINMMNHNYGLLTQRWANMWAAGKL